MIQFINLYESIEEMDPRDKPPVDIIDDDRAFDHWITEFASRKEAQIRSSGKGGQADGHKSVVKFGGFDEEGENQE